MSKEDIEMGKIKELHACKKKLMEEVNCIDAAEELGLKMKIKGNRIQVECPFHRSMLGRDDRSLGNCVISRTGKRCNCFACNGHGDAIEMVMAYNGMCFSEAVDWLAGRRAPHLMEGMVGRSREKPEKCPFTDEEFNVIGIHTSRFLIPVGAAPSKYAARNKPGGKGKHREIVYPAENNDDYVILCESARMDIRDIFYDNKQIFWQIVEPKAMEAAERYRDQIESLERNRKGEEPLRDLMVEELTSRLKIAKKFIH